MPACGFCEQDHGPLCPSVKALEYHPDGTLKRVEFVTEADFIQPTPTPFSQQVDPPTQWWQPINFPRPYPLSSTS